MAEIRIEAFDAAKHRRGEFDCGNTALNEFLRTLVSQYGKRRLGTTFVAVPADGSGRVIGYYTLAASSLAFDYIPRAIARKLPRHPVPTVLVGRLAVDRNWHGRGVGKALLYDALRLALSTSNSVGVFAVEVLAIDKQAAAFYAKFEFEPLLDDPLHMYLLIKTIEEANADKPPAN